MSPTSSNPPCSACAASQAAAALVGELIRCLLAGDGSGVGGALADRLEHAVVTYEVEFRGYLGGERQRPPYELGEVLVTAFSELAGGKEGGGVFAFRVAALEARFNVARRLLTQRLERCDRRFVARPPRAA